MEEQTGKVALVTGAGRGLGEAICRELSDAGVTIVAGDIRLDMAEKVAKALRDKDRTALAFRLDVADEDFVENFVDSAIAELGRVDFLINNAGIDVTEPVKDMLIADWDRIIGVNLRGPFLMAKRVIPHMVERNTGHIVNIVSTAAKRAWPNASAYHASKWGLLGLSHALHAELREHMVKVTAVVAGGMRTEFLLERFPDIDITTLQEPKNVAETVRFVLSQPEATVIPEVMVLPMRETSWP